MKKTFEYPEIDLLNFQTEDILTASSGNWEDEELGDFSTDL